MELNDVPIEDAATTAIELFPVAPAATATLDDVLDATTIVTTCRADPAVEEAWLAEWVDEVQNDVETAIQSRGDGKRAMLLHASELLQTQLQEGEALAGQLNSQYAVARNLQQQIDSADVRRNSLGREIQKRRLAEARVRVATAIANLDEQRKQAHAAMERVALADFEERKQEWEATAADRQRRVDALTKEGESIRAIADATRDRAKAVNQRLVTRTVAGFLARLGYVSIPATGAVFELLLEDRDFTLDWILDTARDFVEAPLASWQRFSFLFGVLLLCLLLIVGATWAVDKLITRFDGRWRRRQRERNDGPATQVGGEAVITRRSFVRLFAMFPYVLAGCMVVAFVAAAKTKGNIFEGFIVPATYAAIGSTIGMLATAVMMMYAIKVIEPRESGTSFHRGWEFALGPAAVVLAVALTALIARDVRWSAWMLFMLVGSLSLAYGLIYHGVYKDADKAQDRVTDLDEQLRFEIFGPERPELSARNIQRRNDLDAEYVRDRLRLERIERDLKLGLFPTNGQKKGDAKSIRYWLYPKQWIAFLQNDDRPRSPELDLHIVDSEIASDLLEQLDSAVRQKARLENDKRIVDRNIEDAERETSRERRNRLRNDLADVKGKIDEFTAEDDERIARASKGANELRLRIRAQIAAATPLRPFMTVAPIPAAGRQPEPAQTPRELPPAPGDPV